MAISLSAKEHHNIKQRTLKKHGLPNGQLPSMQVHSIADFLMMLYEIRRELVPRDAYKLYHSTEVQTTDAHCTEGLIKNICLALMLLDVISPEILCCHFGRLQLVIKMYILLVTKADCTICLCYLNGCAGF